MNVKKKTLVRYSVIAIIMLVITSSLAYGYVQLISKSFRESSDQYMKEVSIQVAYNMQKIINKELQTLNAIATFIGEHEDIHLENVMPVLNKEGSRNSVKRMGIIKLNGKAVSTDNYNFDYSDKSYFKSAKLGISNVSDVFVDEIDGGKVNIFAVPIYKNSEVIAVLFETINTEKYSEILSVSTFGGNGYSFVGKKNGEVVFNPNNKNVTDSFKNIFVSNTDGGLNKSVSNKGTEIEKIIVGDAFQYVTYTPMNTNDWIVFTAVPENIVLQRTNKLILYTIIICIIIISLFAFLIFFMFNLKYKSVRSLEKIAYLDPITGGYNWNKFKLEVGKTLLTDYANQYALVMLDIGKFKVLNDRYGYVRCNDLLKHIEAVLVQAKSENEIIARMNADNFGFLVEYDDNNKLINRLVEIEEKVKGFNKAYNINLSFGIYIIQDKKAPVSKICDNAHFAKQSTKSIPKSNYGFYDKKLIEDIHLQERIEVNMKKALDDNTFEVWYQPKYNIMDDTFVGAEALARWNDKELGAVSPGEFIPIAEKNGTVTRIDMYVLRQVCKDIRAWMDKGVNPIPVSVNFSRLNLENDDFIHNLNLIIKEYNVPANLIEIELTENICLNNRKDLFEIIKRLRADGFVVDMDDFGSGYSSLGLLKDIPVDVLKLDREFLVSSFNEDRAKKVISNIVLLSKDINIKLVAEGVETKEQVEFLKEINCEIVQGFYFARPMPVSEFEDLVYAS